MTMKNTKTQEFQGILDGLNYGQLQQVIAFLSLDVLDKKSKASHSRRGITCGIRGVTQETGKF
jgi:hypothetical protein